MRIPGWLFLLGVVTLFGVTALCAVLSFVTTQRLVVDLGSRGVQISDPIALARVAVNPSANRGTQVCDINCQFNTVPTATQTATPLPTATFLPGVTPTVTVPGPTATVDPLAGIQPVTDPRRFNLLLLGIDQRTGDTERFFRTDTMMVISIDPVRKTAGILSIPRDLWVTIPGSQPNRINTANQWGDSIGYPGGGGPALAAETVRVNLGIEVDSYLLINFDVFYAIADAVAPNGVEICVRDTIDDPYYPDAGYGFIHVHFDPGCQRLNSEQLLQYARTRHGSGDDFGRARRQQEVIRAVQSEVLSAGGVSNFVGRIPELWTELSGSFKTDLSLEEILSLAVLAGEIDQDNMRFGVIDNMVVQNATTSSGDQVLLPNLAAIRTLVNDTFNPPTSSDTGTTELSLADLRTRAEAENASIVIYNNTEISGLAGQTEEWFISKGVSITAVGNMTPPTGGDTTIRLYQNKPWTARYLAALLGLPEDRIISSPGDGLTSEAIMVVAGADIQALLTAGE